MTTVGDLLGNKNTPVYSVEKDASVLDATRAMNRHHVGAVVVLDARERVLGMFTERDVMRRVVAEQLDPTTTRVGEVMSEDVVCCTHLQSLDEIRTIMKERRIRHLPVVDATEWVIGMLSIGDLNAAMLRNDEIALQHMEQYINGRL